MKTTDQYTFQNHEAVWIAEGIETAKNQEEFIAAWQHIYDTGLYQHLQGWYGRRIQDMIDMGYLEP